MLMISESYEADLLQLEDVMDEDQFQDILSKKSSSTKPYYTRAKILILKGLLTSGKDSRTINNNTRIIGGSYNLGTKEAEARIFIIHGTIVKLLWKGSSSQYYSTWQTLRDTISKKYKKG